MSAPTNELIGTLARAMLMADLMSCRLAAAYREKDCKDEDTEELIAALEAENAALRRGLSAAQERILNVDSAA